MLKAAHNPVAAFGSPFPFPATAEGGTTSTADLLASDPERRRRPSYANRQPFYFAGCDAPPYGSNSSSASPNSRLSHTSAT